MRALTRFLGLAALFLAISIGTNLVMNAPASQAGPPPCIPGDANGDGALDISDPTYLLGYLFLQGPAPAACAQPPQPDADEVALLQEILPHLSVEFLEDGQGGTNKTIRFTGVNVQVVNGLGGRRMETQATPSRQTPSLS